MNSLNIESGQPLFHQARANDRCSTTLDSASWMSKCLSKRMRNFLMWASQPCVLSTTQRCLPAVRCFDASPGNPPSDGPLTRITSGMPLAFTMMCRLEPSSPRSVGLALELGTDEPSMLVLLPQPLPARYAAAVVQGLGEVLPWDGCLQHEQDSVENGLIAHDELSRIAFGGRCEDRGKGLPLSHSFLPAGRLAVRA